ncbi:hypothetical protein MCP1_1320001 [Candidatus Terasakiella magnetica]|nr:hypothetical protein MCP1_1320001 [Candidatus Terasakiella magnetica]
MDQTRRESSDWVSALDFFEKLSLLAKYDDASIDGVFLNYFGFGDPSNMATIVVATKPECAKV